MAAFSTVNLASVRVCTYTGLAKAFERFFMLTKVTQASGQFVAELGTDVLSGNYIRLTIPTRIVNRLKINQWFRTLTREKNVRSEIEFVRKFRKKPGGRDFGLMWICTF